MSFPADSRADWRDDVIAGSTALPGSATVRCMVGNIGGAAAVIAAWDFSDHGGSFGAADADAFIAATQAAIDRSLPLITLLRSGGTRLTEGIRALVGIPRSTLALQRLRAAGQAHISVADHPTMGGVWVSIGSHADLRLAVAGSLVGFSGPRAVAAMTGQELADGANTAEAAYDAGLVDAVAEPAAIRGLLARTLAVLDPDVPTALSSPVAGQPPERDGWQQVVASRTESRPSGAELLERILAGAIPLGAADDTVAALVGRLAGRRVVGVALAADRHTMPTPAGFAVLSRAARLADSLDLGLVVLVDTPGADPHTEADGVAAAIAEAMTAVLETRAPTVSLVHGCGGSGGALAGAVTDVVGVGPHGWFAALGPEGAGATLRIAPEEAARMMQITPAELLRDGFADDFVAAGQEQSWLAATIDRLRSIGPAERMAQRLARWSSGLPTAP
jgi:acetyl-CoA carboxylase carboxyl transferase subunit beta